MIKIDDIQEECVKIEGTFNGLPYRGPMLYLKSSDSEDKLPKLIKQLRVARFDTEKAEDLKQYEEVCQKITDGEFQLSMEKIEYDPVKKNWIILLRWIELWYGPPNTK